MGDHEKYLKTQQLADALGVSTSSVKRWVDKGVIPATKTTGNHRLVTLSSALKFARDAKYPTGNLLAMSAHPAAAGSGDDLVKSLIKALKSGQVGEASALIASAYQAEADAAKLADGLIRPVMERIGHFWFIGAWDIYEEHQACQMVSVALVELIRRASQDKTPGRPLALGAAPEGDLYTLPILLAELVLREGGWDVRNLGSDLPLRSLAAAIRTYRPKLVFLSASLVADKPRFLQEYSYFYEAASQVGAAIIVGGRALDADLRSRLIYASFGERMAHLAEFARQLHPLAESEPADRLNQSEPMDNSTT